MVVFASKSDLSLQEVLNYPITCYPLSISHSDGTGLKTDKSKLMARLESYQDGFQDRPLPATEHVLIDGGLILHSHLSSLGYISSYESLARSLLGQVCRNNAQTVHVLFDKYRECSLKSNERDARGSVHKKFVITGSEQSPKLGCQKLLRIPSFKEELAKFLLKEWQNNNYVHILGAKTLFVSHGGECLKYKAESEIMLTEKPLLFQANHEEADTLIGFHLSKLHGNAVIRSSDTDVLVVAIAMLALNKVPIDSENDQGNYSVILDCGTSNNRRYIDVNSIRNHLESKQKNLAIALPGLHAFTGCDFTEAFNRKGKVKGLEILEKDSGGNLIEAFRLLAVSDDVDFSSIENFVCNLYGLQCKASDVNTARLVKLNSLAGTYGTWKKNLKNVDCALLPPCSKTLKMKLKRAQYVTKIWCNADLITPNENLDVLSYGWQRDGNSLNPIWYSGNCLPSEISAGIFPETEDSDEDASEGCYSDASGDEL